MVLVPVVESVPGPKKGPVIASILEAVDMKVPDSVKSVTERSVSVNPQGRTGGCDGTGG